ncbi:MAG TPA: DNA methyltransferase [Steroidobacteraceae bacterium]|jgi:site-specific DNA-methyltransferase (adenine-specific)|nr:DNA methyltransferase [Steroidobacteraceae bacterium]
MAPKITLTLGNALVFATPERVSSFDHMITDPPFSAHVHTSATSQSKGGGTRKRDLGFDCLTDTDRQKLAIWSQSVKRWSIVYSDVESVNDMRIACEAAGAEYVRTMPWVRWSMPQLSGDRPPQGFEALLVTHRQYVGPRGGRRPLAKRWNGPGNLTALLHSCLRGDDKNKAEKPLDQALDLVSWFTEPGETVFDPYAGRATIGLACRLLGRGYVGFEIRQREFQRAKARLEGPLSARDLERMRRYLEASYEPQSEAAGPAVRRARQRAADRERVMAWMPMRAEYLAEASP